MIKDLIDVADAVVSDLSNDHLWVFRVTNQYSAF